MTQPTPDAAPRPAGRPRPRAGAALPTALLMLVVTTLLAAGAFAMSRQTFRGGRDAMVEQRALAVAEYGLNRRIASWDTRFNVAPAPAGTPCNAFGAGGIPVGCVSDSSIYVPTSASYNDTARVLITRLDPLLYLVESRGRAHIPNPALQASRTVSSLVRLAYPTIDPRGAVTAGGNVTLRGNATVDGTDRIPSVDGNTWSTDRCPNTLANMPSVATPPGSSVTLQGSATTIGPRVLDPLAGDSNTYVRFGTENWTTLVGNADVIMRGNGSGTIQGPNGLGPTATNGRCDITGTNNGIQNNWGEPWDGVNAVAPCRNYFPIVYADTNLQLQSNSRGQGILIVNGTLDLRGGFDWLGLIIVRNDILTANGNATVTGAVLARDAVLGDGGTGMSGTQRILYSRCAIEAALRGSALLVRVGERGWAQTY